MARLIFLGQCGFLIEMGGARILTDPCLSDYVHRVNYSAATPWVRRYPAPGRISDYRPDTILISHSHDDHMDPDALRDYAASGGVSPVAAPAPECFRLQHFGIANILPARAGERFFVGQVCVTPVACAHTQIHPDENGDVRELSYILECGGERLFFGGDASLYPGLDESLPGIFTAMLLPVNGRDEVREKLGIVGNMNAREAACLAARHGATLVAMHHDLFAINGADESFISQSALAEGAHCIIPAVNQVFSL